MIRFVAHAALAFALAAPSGATRAEKPACAGKLSGAVSGNFGCTVAVTAGEGGALYLVIAPTGTVEGVPSLVPGSFEVTGLLAPGTYRLDDLGMGKSSVAVEGGALYTATKTTGQRGEARLVVRSARKVKGAWEVHGTWWARLIPAGSGKTGEVVVEVSF
jgi:hypothetical protein